MKKRKISDEDIQMIISEDVEKGLSSVVEKMDQEDYDASALEKIVDPDIITCVESFLKDASDWFGRVYSLAIFQALCIQINGAMQTYPGC